MEEYKIPTHVGIILDGNGRWAKERGLSRSEGHKEGFEHALKPLVRYVFKKGVKVLSVFAFSTENFKRSKEEVDYLMNLFVRAFKTLKKEYNDLNIKVVFSGRNEPLPKKVLKIMKEIEKDTKDNTNGIFNICLNYGGRAEIVDATKKIAQKVLNGEIKIDEIDEKTLEKNMYNELPSMDFLIRTSGEVRISNFMLYEAAYAEMYFPNVYFPDFKEEEFDKALDVYNKRDRRFGGIKK